METQTKLPYYYKSIDFNKLVNEYEPPIEFMDGTRKWSRDQIESTQLNRLHETLARGAEIPFFQRLMEKT